uniref:Solute carrier family 38 member 5a n=1 Tax=Eptatretus burgeri TaxID=7764 RepID=A0A8C4Q5A6_EPTBU
MARDELELRPGLFTNDDDSRDEDTETLNTEKGTINSQYDELIETENENFLNGGMKKFEKHEGKASFGMSVFNLANAIMGSGVLGLAYAMANTGILLFIILLVGVTILSCYSIHLLLVTSDTAGTKSYEQLGYITGRRPVQLISAGAIIMQNIGAMSSYLFIIKYELPAVIQGFCSDDVIQQQPWFLTGDYLVILVSIGIILPLCCMKNIGYLGYTSTFSVCCMVFFEAVIIYKKFNIPCPLGDLIHHADSFNTSGSLSMAGNHRPPPATLYSDVHNHSTNHELEQSCIARYIIFNSQTAYAVPILAFSFVCHPEVLPIYTEISQPTRQRMQNVSNIAVFAMFIMYLLTAIFGYLTFYELVEAELLHTYMRTDPHGRLIQMVRCAVLIAVTLTVPIVLFPMRTSVEEIFFHNKRFSWIRHIAVAVCMLIFVILLVIYVPSIRDIFGFIGASAATLLIFILPAMFYLRIVKKPPRKHKLMAYIFIIAGFIFMISSMALIIADWVQHSGHH